ncbi:MAG: YqeG family HAD IIIA-type phosphatase [Clostridiales bacterium]|jgi:HAD superfamily phosphatase (TIGR01668 family)|nr:YqeG family HAD IIIA-type phosphatase [Clostridiales bacterium]
MNDLIPRYVFDRITDITPEIIKAMGAKAVAFDLDNTLVYDSGYRLLKGAEEWIESMKKAGIPLFIITNTYKLRADIISKRLKIEAVANSRKPRPDGFIKAAEHLGVKVSELAMIGDQIYKDIAGANAAGAISVYVRPFMKEKMLYFYYKRLRAKEREFIEQNKDKFEVSVFDKQID